MRFPFRRMPLLLLVFLIGAGITAADDENSRQNEIESLREELESKRSRQEALGEKEKDIIFKLRDIEEQIALSSQLILKIDRESRNLDRGIISQEGELQTSRELMTRKEKVLHERLRYIYKFGDMPGWMGLISSPDPTGALAALKNMRALVSYDRHLVRSYNELSAAVEFKIVKLLNDRGTLDDLKEKYLEEIRMRETALDTRKRLLIRVRGDKSHLEKSIENLEDDVIRVAGIFDDIQAESEDDTIALNLPGLNNSRGDLIWPVHGKILSEFGTNKDKRGIKLTNPGIDIKASIGANVKSAASGRIIYISWLRGYGQFIIIDHGRGYYTLYSNLDDIFVEPGDNVLAGEVIARAGESGYFDSPSLHFELRLKKEQLNPVEWLR